MWHIFQSYLADINSKLMSCIDADLELTSCIDDFATRVDIV